MRKLPQSLIDVIFLILALGWIGVPSLLAETPETPPLHGFSHVSAARQHQLESRFDATLDADNLRQWMKRLTAHPHPVGSLQGKANADFMAELFRSWGFETRIETFHVLFPTPKTRVVEMLAPTRFTAGLVEPPIEGDSTSYQQAEHLPTYNAYSIDGDVTGELIYVNRGLPRDYEELARRGLDVKGKIVIVRDLGAWRGVKPKVAADRGAIGCLIFPDPGDEGYAWGSPYPDGGWINEHTVWRGAVSDITNFSGDPLTPFVGATEDAERLPMDHPLVRGHLTRIPVTSISYGDALPLMRALGGPMSPEEWRGALPIPYRMGPGPAKVHLKLEFHWDMVPVHNVIAVMPGSELPDQWVLRGNHHDAWVYGAADPVINMVGLLEEARAVGELVKAGHRPRRTLVYAAWDGEEAGLRGSVEWVETHAEELSEKAVAYVNTDSQSRGFLWMIGSQTLERLFNQVARDVVDPKKGISVLERTRAANILWGGPAAAKDARERQDLRLIPPGSGSDYTPFLQHLGIASVFPRYLGEGEGSLSHSIYESYESFVRFTDPDFAYGVAIAETTGRLVLRLANADVLPFEFINFADNMKHYVGEISGALEALRAETREENLRIAEGSYAAVADPDQIHIVPEALGEVPELDLTPLNQAVEILETTARAYDDALGEVLSGRRALAPARRLELDRILMKTERALTRKEGLPGRAWYRHQIYAPGVYTGYQAKTLPSVREAVEERRWADAREQIVVVAGVLEAFAGQVERATLLLASE